MQQSAGLPSEEPVHSHDEPARSGAKPRQPLLDAADLLFGAPASDLETEAEDADARGPDMTSSEAAAPVLRHPEDGLDGDQPREEVHDLREVTDTEGEPGRTQGEFETGDIVGAEVEAEDQKEDHSTDELAASESLDEGQEEGEEGAPPLLAKVDASAFPSLLPPGALPKHLFDWEYYCVRHDLSFTGEEEAWAHFEQVGFPEQKNPSPFVDVAHVRFLAAEAGHQLADARAFLGWCSQATASWVLGLSPRYSPAWIAAQLMPDADAAADAMALDKLLSRPLRGTRLSLHPGLRRLPPRWGTTVADVIRSLEEADAKELSHVDLADYTRNHRDLAQQLTTPWDTFDHCWSVGLRQNRLKHLGTTAPRRLALAQIMINAVAVIFQRKLRSRVLDPDLALASLPQHGAAPFPTSIESLRAVLGFDATNPAEPPTMADLLEMVEPVESRLDFYLSRWPAVNVGLSLPVIGLIREVTDMDLLSGRRRERGRRVVYSINLGLYDENPVPPELDDCAYYLITDAATIEPDRPWRIVRPTLLERDRKRLCLWYKTHPHLLFQGVEHSVWIDANIDCLPGSERILQAQEVLAEVATFRHPDRDCIYEEGKAIIALGLDVPEVINAVLDRLRKAGMPRRAGLFETNVLYTKPQDAAVSRFLDRWWREIFMGSRRDQMSFTFAALQCGITIHELDGRASAKTSRFFRKRPHRHDHGRSVA